LLIDVIINYKSPADEVCTAYLGLAALGEPVLLDIKELIKSDTLSIENKLDLATALALLGDYGSAKEWYNNNILPLINLENIMIKDYEFTANTLVISSCLNVPYYDELLNYVLQNKSNTYLPVLDIMGALTCMKSPAKTESSFSYELNGEIIIADFREKWVHELTLNEDMLQNANFKRISGEIGVNAYFVGGADILSTPSNNAMIISKRLNENTVSVGRRIKVTQLVDVEFTKENEFFVISDVVPAGTRFDGTETNRNSDRPWSVNEENGKLKIIVYNLREHDQEFKPVRKQITIIYYLRAVLPGENAVPGSILMSSSTLGYAACDNSILTIVN